MIIGFRINASTKDDAPDINPLLLTASHQKVNLAISLHNCLLEYALILINSTFLLYRRFWRIACQNIIYNL